MDEELRRVRKYQGAVETVDAMKRRVAKTVPAVLNDFRSNVPLSQRVRDSIIMRDISMGGGNMGMDGASGNLMTMSGVNGQDPSLSNFVTPNLWVSPQEVAAIFSQKGIEELIIRKKSQSIMLNGAVIKNPYFSAEQFDRVNENMHKTNLDGMIANGVRDSLAYGGDILFPMFKKDSPATMGMTMEQLAKLGVIGKDCISHYVNLDRWNTMHLPNYNPTAADFLTPLFYFVPFLGADVNAERIGRIVTAQQPGYWGTVMTLGWGVSDIMGWYEALVNYRNIMRSIPTMINQMSLLVRTMNIDGILASEGANFLEDLDMETTVKLRQASVNNPINMDVVGDVKSIQRDFAEVPELVRMIRQDVAAKAAVPEELIWSSERGAFSSGDTGDSAFEKQSESTRFIHIDVERQVKNVVMLHVISTLGLDRDLLRKIEYTSIEFNNPRITNAKDKAEIAAHVGDFVFNTVASGVPVDSALDMAVELSDNEFSVSTETMEKLRALQKVKDDRATEEHDKNMEMLTAQIDNAKNGDQNQAGGKPVKDNAKTGKGASHGYKDRLEQRQHEVTRGGATQKQGLSKASNKAL